jgi:hypothetical protein
MLALTTQHALARGTPSAEGVALQTKVVAFLPIRQESKRSLRSCGRPGPTGTG